jgi:hypothetical protein
MRGTARVQKGMVAVRGTQRNGGEGSAGSLSALALGAPEPPEQGGIRLRRANPKCAGTQALGAEFGWVAYVHAAWRPHQRRPAGLLAAAAGAWRVLWGRRPGPLFQHGVLGCRPRGELQRGVQETQELLLLGGGRRRRSANTGEARLFGCLDLGRAGTHDRMCRQKHAPTRVSAQLLGVNQVAR